MDKRISTETNESGVIKSPEVATTPEINEKIEACLTDVAAYSAIQKPSQKEVNKAQVTEIITKISRIKDLDFKTTVLALATLFRRGAANAGAPDSMQVDVLCPGTKNATEISRYDITMAMQSVVDHKNVRKLAEAMAPELISAGLKILEKNDLIDLKGDLANRINRKLALRKEPALTRKEEICCSTYAQWMPNLNTLADSTRLKGLLEEDLNARRKKVSKSKSKKSKKAEAKDLAKAKKEKKGKQA